MYVYRPRGMPSRFMAGAPEIVRRGVIDVIATRPEPLDFDVILRPEDGDTLITGLDFGRCGSPGCHFFLVRHEARAYRERSRRKRVAWADLPESTRAAILSYFEE